MTTTFATFNGGNAPEARTPGDLHLIGADITGVQEAHDRQKAIAHWCRVNGQASVPFTHGLGDTPILYSIDVAHLLSFDSTVVNPHPVDVSPPDGPAQGNGPSVIHPKYVTHAKFWLRNERRLVHVLNTHLLASWTRHDLPPAEERARRALAELHVKTILEVAARLHGTVVLLGDFNGTLDEPLLHRLITEGGFEFGKTGPTEGGRTIDLVGVRGKHVTKTRRIVIDGTSSDHKPVKARLTFEQRLKYLGLGSK